MVFNLELTEIYKYWKHHLRNVMKYKLLTVLVCVLLVGTIATSGACDLSHDDSTPTSSQPYEIKVQYIEASSDYEYGVKAGRMYAGMIKLLPSILPDQLANMGMPSLSLQITSSM